MFLTPPPNPTPPDTMVCPCVGVMDVTGLNHHRSQPRVQGAGGGVDRGAVEHSGTMPGLHHRGLGGGQLVWQFLDGDLYYSS